MIERSIASVALPRNPLMPDASTAINSNTGNDNAPHSSSTATAPQARTPTTAFATISRLRSCLSTKVPPNTLATCCAIIDNVPSQPAATVEPDTAYPSRLIASARSAAPTADAVSAVNQETYPADCQNDFAVPSMSCFTCFPCSVHAVQIAYGSICKVRRFLTKTT